MKIVKKSVFSAKLCRQSATAILSFLSVASGICFLAHPSFYTAKTATDGTVCLVSRTMLMELLLLVLAAIFLAFRTFLSEKLRRAAHIWPVVLFLLTPALTLKCTDVIINVTPSFFSLTSYGGLTAKTVFYNLIVLVMLLLMLLTLTNSWKLSCAVCLIGSVLFCIANYYVCMFRDAPILAGDFTVAATALTVAGNFTYRWNVQCLIVLQVCLDFILFLRCLPSGKLCRTVRKRLLFSVFSVPALILFVNQFFLSDFLAREKIEINRLRPLASYRQNGVYLTLVRSFQYLRIEPPDGYSAEQVSELAQAYPSDTASTAEDLPNVIVVVDEAFCDPAVLGNLSVSEDYMPFFHSLQKSCTHGYTYASVLGGGTANTEFEVLTGNSVVLLPQNCIPFQYLIRQEMPSLATWFAQLGYQGLYAVHPYQAANYNRSNVYPLLGFRTYLSSADFPSDAPMLRNFLSDMAVNQMIIQKYEETRASGKEPFFLYTMTMQNHSYYETRYENCPSLISLPNFPGSDDEYYVNLLRYSDQALENLIGYFEQCEEPTAILFLGDHQPKFSKRFLNAVSDNTYENWSPEEMMKRYAIPFVLWTNYDVPAREYPKTSMNYLQAILADTLHLPKTGYQKYLLDLMQEIPALTSQGYWGSDGTFYDIGDASSPYYKTLMQYESALYQNILHPEKCPDDFLRLQ